MIIIIIRELMKDNKMASIRINTYRTEGNNNATRKLEHINIKYNSKPEYKYPAIYKIVADNILDETMKWLCPIQLPLFVYSQLRISRIKEKLFRLRGNILQLDCKLQKSLVIYIFITSYSFTDQLALNNRRSVSSSLVPLTSCR